MAENSKIEWTDHTFNPWVGCTKISPACDHCCAESWAKRSGSPELWQHFDWLVCAGLEQLWAAARTAKQARARFFEHIRTITAYLVFPNWTTLMQTLIDSKPPPHVEAQLAR